MSGPVLYSTNVFLKLLIQERYRKNIHYVWCSESFDSRMLSGYTPSALVPPSSNPANIYRDLKDACDRSDSHNAKIAAQKASFVKLAIKWAQDGEITTSEKDDIIYLVNTAAFNLWRPLIYVVPREPVEFRLQLVPAAQRAGFGNEYIISDLRRSEFDIIEL